MTKTIIEAFPSLLTSGAFFTNLSIFNKEGVTLTPAQAGKLYALVHSGRKEIGLLAESYLDSTGVVSSAGILAIGQIIESLYGENWDRAFDAFYADYNPLENYNGSETESTTTEGDVTLSDEYGARHNETSYGQQTETLTKGAGSITTQYGATSETLGGGTDTTTHRVSGFNQAGYTNDSQDETSVASRTNSAQAHTDTVNETQKIDSNQISSHKDEYDEFAKEDTHTTTHDLTVTRTNTKSGNLGLTTSQQMINSELELRVKNFFNIVFDSIDEILTSGCLTNI